jgi:hypothetical protein
MGDPGDMSSQTVALEPQPPGTAVALRRAAVVITTFVIGIGLGIGLTIVSVVLPRKVELNRVELPSSFFTSFNPKGAIQAGAPASLEVVEEAQDTELNGSRMVARWFVYRCKVPSVQHQSFLESVTSSIQSQVRPRVRGPRMIAWASPTYASSRVSGQSFVGTRALGYQIERRSGHVRIWGSGRGDELVLSISIVEK